MAASETGWLINCTKKCLPTLYRKPTVIHVRWHSVRHRKHTPGVKKEKKKHSKAHCAHSSLLYGSDFGSLPYLVEA